MAERHGRALREYPSDAVNRYQADAEYIENSRNFENMLLLFFSKVQKIHVY